MYISICVDTINCVLLNIFFHLRIACSWFAICNFNNRYLSSQLLARSFSLQFATMRQSIPRYPIFFSIAYLVLTLASVAVAMFKALLRTTLAVGAKATAEPTRREAIASFILTIFCGGYESSTRFLNKKIEGGNCRQRTCTSLHHDTRINYREKVRYFMKAYSSVSLHRFFPEHKRKVL